MATTVAGSVSYKNQDDKAVNVALTSTVAKGAVIVAESWVGIAGADGVSGDTVAITVVGNFQVKVPAGLTATKGLIIYITVATITGHYPDDEAYTTSSGAGKVAFMKVTVAKDSNNIVEGTLLAYCALAS